jgi:hypothetical protein
MSDIAIRVENCILSRVEGLSKRYRIGRAQQRHDTLRDAVAGLRLQVAGSFRPRHLQPANLEPPTDLWALRDVPFGRPGRVTVAGVQGHLPSVI